LTTASAGIAQIFRRNAVIAVALACSWLTVRNAAIRTYGETSPDTAAVFRPASAVALAAIAQRRFVASRGAADPETVRLTHAALRAYPAGALPLILAGLAASAHGEADRALRLMRMARARDPREAIARYWLLDHYIRGGEYDAGLDEIGPALRLRPEAGPAIFALLAGLNDLPGADDAVARALARDPDWRAAFFAARSVAGAQPLALLRLLRRIPPARDPSAAAAEQRSVLFAAVQSGAYDEAYAAWRRFLPASGSAKPGTVYDPTFRGLPGPEPFNWIIQRTGESRAIMTPAGPSGPSGLDVSSFSTARTIVAEQYVTVSGRQTLSVGVAAGAVPQGVTTARVACARNDATLVELPLVPGPVPRRGTASFTVPAVCGAVRVQIVASPGDTPGRTSVRITEVRIDTA
jgi:tetratricopeptide (TPR) repeat protein